jgi:predicted DNA-binding transcriptional regulator AlpA
MKQVPFDFLASGAYARKPQVLEFVPWSATTLWRKCRAGEFPAPYKLSAGVTAWRVDEIRAWAEDPSGYSAQLPGQGKDTK